MKKEATAVEKFKIINARPWLSRRDICRFLGCGLNKATQHLKEMYQEIEDTGKLYLRGRVSVAIFLNHFKIDLKDIYAAAKRELELERLKVVRENEREQKAV